MKGSGTVTAFWNGLSWSGLLEIIWSKLLLKAGVTSMSGQVIEVFLAEF